MRLVATGDVYFGNLEDLDHCDVFFPSTFIFSDMLAYSENADTLPDDVIALGDVGIYSVDK